MTNKIFVSMKFTIIAITLVALPNIAIAAETSRDGPQIRGDIIVEKNLVTLGDLFENAGPNADVAVFRAPDLGNSGKVRASRVQAAANRHGLTWTNREQIETVEVTRASTQVADTAVISSITAAIRSRTGLAQSAELTVTLAANDLPYHLPSGDSGALEVVRLDYNPKTGYFRADLRSADGSRTSLRTAFRGQAIETVKIPVLIRNIARGSVIRADDIAYHSVPRRTVRADILQSGADIVGMAARRTLQAKQPIRTEDTEPPKLVRRNTAVIIVYQHSGMTLSVRGRAIADGALGEMVPVMNIRSNRIIEGVVSGHGKITIEQLGAPRVSTASQQTTTQLASSR